MRKEKLVEDEFAEMSWLRSWRQPTGMLVRRRKVSNASPVPDEGLEPPNGFLFNEKVRKFLCSAHYVCSIMFMIAWKVIEMGGGGGGGVAQDF